MRISLSANLSLQIANISTKSERCFFKLRFSAPHCLADFATEIHFSREKTGHVNAPNRSIHMISVSRNKIFSCNHAKKTIRKLKKVLIASELSSLNFKSSVCSLFVIPK